MGDVIPDQTEWVGRAKCAGADTNLFYDADTAGGGRDWKPALAICDGCPVRSECLQWALDTEDYHGVFGGTTPQQRWAMTGHTGVARRKSALYAPGAGPVSPQVVAADPQVASPAMKAARQSNGAERTRLARERLAHAIATTPAGLGKHEYADAAGYGHWNGLYAALRRNEDLPGAAELLDRFVEKGPQGQAGGRRTGAAHRARAVARVARLRDGLAAGLGREGAARAAGFDSARRASQWLSNRVTKRVSCEVALGFVDAWRAAA